MIKTAIHVEDGIVTVTPEGPLEKADFEQLSAEVDAYLETAGPLNGLIIEIPSFPGWEDFTGFIEHIRFIRDHHRRVKRVAVLTEAKPLEFLPRLARHFVAAEIEPFGPGDFARARQWILQAE